MVRTAWRLIPTVAAVSLVLLVTGKVKADPIFVAPPVVSYYYAPPTVTYYSPPIVYAPAPAVSYYYPAVSYYTPSVSYYAAPAAVRTTYYGLFGRPRVSTTYYPPVYVGR